MPSIKLVPQANTTDALQGNKFKKIPANGAIINVWASGATAGDKMSLSIENQELLVDAEVNLESNTDAVDTVRDQLLFDEVIPGGELYLPATLTTEMQILINIRYL